MNILVTGGAGFVGSACLRWLVKHGHNPIAYDNLKEGHIGAVPSGRLVIGDIANTTHESEFLGNPWRIARPGRQR